MEPIINPWIFYLLEKVGIVIFFGISLAFVSAAFIFLFETEKRKTWTVIGIISILIAILTPSSNTICKMLIASYVTPNNIELTIDGAIGVVDRIVEKVDELMEKND